MFHMTSWPMQQAGLHNKLVLGCSDYTRCHTRAISMARSASLHCNVGEAAGRTSTEELALELQFGFVGAQGRGNRCASISCREPQSVLTSASCKLWCAARRDKRARAPRANTCNRASPRAHIGELHGSAPSASKRSCSSDSASPSAIELSAPSARAASAARDTPALWLGSARNSATARACARLCLCLCVRVRVRVRACGRVRARAREKQLAAHTSVHGPSHFLGTTGSELLGLGGPLFLCELQYGNFIENKEDMK